MSFIEAINKFEKKVQENFPTFPDKQKTFTSFQSKLIELDSN